MKKRTSMILTGALCLALKGQSAMALTDAEYSQASAAINAKYEPTYDAAQKEGEDIESEGGSCLFEAAFDADWEMTTVSFDIPEIFMKNREFSFHTLKSKMSTKVIAKTKIPVTEWGMTTVMGVRTKLPKTYTKVQEIRVQVPEFWWDRTSFSMKIPEFYSKRVEWKFHILKIKELKQLDVPCNGEKERAEELGARVETAAEQHKAELTALTREYLKSKIVELDAQRSELEGQFDEGLRALDAAMDEARKAGIDPAIAKVDYNGEARTMLSCKEALEAQKKEALENIDKSRAEIERSLAQMA